MEARKEGDRRKVHAVTAVFLGFLYLGCPLVVFRGPPGHGNLPSLLNCFVLITLLALPALVLTFLFPRLVHRFFNPFAIYTEGISPPFRWVLSAPCPPWVTGWSLRRFLHARRIAWRPGRFFLVYRDIRRIVRIGDWEDGFAFDLILEDGIRIRMLGPDLKAYYFPGDRAALRQAYDLMEEVREQVNAGAESVAIEQGTQFVGRFPESEEEDECLQGLPENADFIRRRGYRCDRCGRDLSLRPELAEVHVAGRRMQVLCASCHSNSHRRSSARAPGVREG